MTAIVYTKPDCPFCDQAKALFEKSGVEYTTRDVTESIADYHFVTEILGAKSVPVVTGTDGTVVFGYQPRALQDLINEEILREDGFDWDGIEEDGRWLH